MFEKVYNVSYIRPDKTGTIPVFAHSRREAQSIVKGRLGPLATVYVTGVRS